MDKNEAVATMIKKGYHVTIEDRIPMFLLENSVHTPAQLKKTLKEIGFTSSFGYKLVGKGTLSKNTADSELRIHTSVDFEIQEQEDIAASKENVMADEEFATVEKRNVTAVEKNITDTEENRLPREENVSASGVNSETDAEEPEFFDEDDPDDNGFEESSLWSDSDDYFESSDGQMSFF